MHQKFIKLIKNNRLGKINEKDTDIFSAQIYSGDIAKELGLVDGLGSITQIMSEKYPNAVLDFEDERPFVVKMLMN